MDAIAVTGEVNTEAETDKGASGSNSHSVSDINIGNEAALSGGNSGGNSGNDVVITPTELESVSGSSMMGRHSSLTLWLTTRQRRVRTNSTTLWKSPQTSTGRFAIWR